MYRVTVFPSNVTGFNRNAAIDAKAFDFGSFAEIGFWLDDCGYNDSRFKVVVHFDA